MSEGTDRFVPFVLKLIYCILAAIAFFESAAVYVQAETIMHQTYAALAAILGAVLLNVVHTIQWPTERRDKESVRLLQEIRDEIRDQS